MATASKGQFVWYEDMTKDPRGAISFYSDVVGWKTEAFQGGGEYTMWVSGQGPLGGVMKPSEEAAKAGAPASWLAHVQVDDVDATAARARQLGGRVYKEPTDIPTVGRLAVIADPQGAAISIFKPIEAVSLHDVSKEGEFCWNELSTSDAAAAFRFYADLFGWKILEEMDMGPMGTYRVFGVGDRRLGGIMTAPKGAPTPPSWLFYAETSDLDAALRRATTKGAKVLNGPMEVPGGGRIAQLQDPQGAAFALHQSPGK
ncbi:MAG TPA: VOC family protein [Anaeromyxobacteraceae bacterium]|nr:VOC family protein [Anaeromyxobacteraceae bacterium]